jgi:chromosome segregation ATPase
VELAQAQLKQLKSDLERKTGESEELKQLVMKKVEENHDLEEKLQREERRYKYVLKEQLQKHADEMEEKINKIKELEAKIASLDAMVTNFMNIDGGEIDKFKQQSRRVQAEYDRRLS